MSTTLQSRLKRAGRWLPVAMLPLLPLAAQAQSLNYTPATAANVAGTYTDLGTTGTVISTSSTDDANSAAQNIGFTFNYNGGSFTQFVLNTNGLIRLGAAAPSVANLFLSQDLSTTQTAVDPVSSTNVADVNLIMPFNMDLVSGTSTAEYRLITTGTAPNRVCTIQWKNVSDKTGTGTDTAPTQYTNFSFQAKLYETTNVVEFVYGPTTASTNAAVSRFPSVGIKGSNATSAVLGNKTTGAGAWSTAVFINGPYTTTTHNIRNAAPADLGRTYRFTPVVLPANDLAVSAVYSLGRVSATYGSPVAAQALVTNNSATTKTAVPVTLTVSGATTFTTTATVATLASGASTLVTFTGYPITATSGTNTLTVTVPTDDVATNNTGTASQAITAAEHSYIQGTTYAGGVGLPLAGNVLAVRYTTTSATATINTITPTFVGAAAVGVTSTYQVLIYSAGTTGQPGTVLYTSPVQTRPTITGATTATPAPVSIPGIAVSGTFFVGLRTIGADNIGIGYQTESPLRAGTFFYTTNAGTTWDDLNTQAISPRLALNVTFGAAGSVCAPVTNAAVGSITNTTASLTFTAPTGATGYIVTVTPASGTATTITPAPTASPVSLTGLTAGTTYTVSVTNNCGTGNISQPVTTTFTTTGGTPGPANDNCATATALTVGTTCTNTVGTTVGATASPAGVPAPSCGGPTLGTLADVWYTVTVPAGGNLTVTTSEVVGSSFDDSVVEIYSGTCGALTSVGCNDDDANGVDGFSSVILTGQTPGATLYVRVRGYDSTTAGQFNICATSTVPCGDPIAATIGNATNTSAQITFTPGSGNTSYNVTYTAGGAVTTITPAPTTSPITINGLLPGTTYIITLQGVCANGTGAVLSGTVTTTGTPAPATYVALPYSEGFEGTWVSGLSTRDLPTANWRNSPATGDRSWRREDDGTSANWRYLPSGAYTPTASAGSHSARFHTYGAGPIGALGFLDLYVNMSTPGTKTLNFNYINPTGTDSLKVFLSTDGGATFAATPLRQLGVSTTFAPVQPISITSTSATTVIRFQARSDFGNDDLGIDNLRLAVVTSTRNEALAATVNLYPNPAHQAFQLSVPAGSLTKASATLTNALGQVVLKRQLSLPVAGGAADFNVSSLAPGVYSLTLKSGDDLVVKRVVVE